MSRVNLEDPIITDCILQKGIKGGVHIQTLAGAMLVDRDMGFVSAIDPGGAIRTITLPAAEKGLMFLMTHNGGAFDITIQDPVGPTTRGTLSTTESALIFSDGIRWYVGVMTTT